ncbi:MAG TPA: hypothetical protein VNT25_02545 [Allosphingosinicella sp.]|nr:hypothetical protein [Allosphingosinicella sp.]
MGRIERDYLDDALSAIEETMLPSAVVALDMLIDAAEMERQGSDRALYAEQVRAIGSHLRLLTREMEKLAALPAVEEAQPAAA